ncbi:DUF4259 domain-containing protein [Streptomyces sp. NPDC004726]
MGTWDIGPFDNDTAADFSGHVDDAPPGERADVLRGALVSVIEAGEYVESYEGARAIAAAALIASQAPGGEPVVTSYGPKLPLPDLPVELRGLAVDALRRVLGKESELVELWEETADKGPWGQGVDRLLKVLSAAAGPVSEPASPSTG